ncbi:hypothetical protein MSG28_006247 [Choristoneura fumiferana]|uniref:Uncharacterized protein n=1 Tax=Choristoneura fumiferana TaxID=7141 RepID=A0ACC0JE76_CHOFU|nr:hypothetical protein MSG28_006247 [Choristoneura fumiferana]
MEAPKENDDQNEVPNFDIKFKLLEFEKQIFIDAFEKDALLILAKGLNYNGIISNLLWVYNDPANLVLVLNSNDYEEKHFMEKFKLSPLPNLGTEREKAYLEGGVHFISTRILVVDLLKNRVPVTNITGIIVLRAHTVLESCQEAFALRLYRQNNKAFSNSPISFTFGYHQVEKVMRAVFVTELFLWPRFHGTIIKCLKNRQAEVVELHVPLTSNMSHIQTCLLDIMNYTVKQLRSINRTLDMQEITTENCISKKFHKILQSHKLIHDDAVSFYALVSKYRTPEYARVNSGWILLDSAEQLFRLAKNRVYNHKNEFDPEHSPKWKVLSDLLLEEIPEEVKKKQKEGLNNTKILILCQDGRTCAQLNHFLTMGPNKYLFYTAFRRDLTIHTVSSTYKNLKDTAPATSELEKEGVATKPDEDNKDVNKLEEEDTEESKTNYILTLTQVATQGDKKKSADVSMFEPISQIDNLDITQIELEKPIICIRTFKENGNSFSLEQCLENLRPEYIILYHSDVAAVRQIELFESRKSNEESSCKVYFVVHDKTVEEQAYLTSLKREKQAFELLIQAKSVMVVPSYQDGKTDEYFNLNEEDDSDAVDTRKAALGGDNTADDINYERYNILVHDFVQKLPGVTSKNMARIMNKGVSLDHLLTLNKEELGQIIENKNEADTLYSVLHVEKVMRAVFVTELFLWPRQAEVVELHVPLTSNMSHIQTCLLDIMNYTVKQLRSINRTLDMQEITTENCISKKFHKILQSHKLIHDDAVSFYALVSKYRTPEYARVNSGWILLDSAEQLFRLAKNRVYNHKNEFDPEHSPKWKVLSDLLLEEIPEEVKKKQKEGLNNTKILILCQDGRTCAQLNHFLTMGPNKYLFYTAFRRDLTIHTVSSTYKNLKDTAPATSELEKEGVATKPDEDNKDVNKLEEEDTEESKTNYILTLTQVATQGDKKKSADVSMFEPISQIDNLDITQIELEKPIICIRTFKENGNSFSLEQCLENLRPEYIILYHSDVAAVRQIELFESRKSNEESSCKVYFVVHDKTVEEQAYLTSLKREKQAFELLIQAKSVMVVPSYQDGKTDEYFNLNEEDDSDAVDTRKADIQQKLQLLTIHFPRLKLVWSPSPYATAELFYELKEELGQIIENKNEADTLYSVLHVKAKPADAGKDDKPFGKKKFTGKLFRSKKT